MTLPHASITIGVDLGGTNVKTAVFNEEGRVLWQGIRESGFGTEEVLGNIIASIQDSIDNLRPGTFTLSKIGIGSPGVVDNKHGIITHSLNLGIQRLELTSVLSRQFGCPVHLENDVNATALGLAALNPELGSLAFVNFGTGLAAGLVISGKIWKGHSGPAGEIGHIPVGASTEPCPCGQAGCLELYASWSGLRSLVPNYAEFSLLVEDIESPGRAHALSVFRTNAVRSLLTVFLTLDPEVVFIGGGLVSHWSEGFEEILSEWRLLVKNTPLLQGGDLENRVRNLPSGVPIAAIGVLRA